jgi:hypothetical protein
MTTSAVYEDFVVSIDSAGPGAYRARVLDSPGGQGSGPFVPPWLPAQLAAIRGFLVRTLGVGRGAQLLDAPAVEPLRALGEGLASALLTGEVGQRFAVSRALARERGRSLRICLRLDLQQEALRWLANVPWELLTDGLRLDGAAPLVRYLEAPCAARQRPVAHPLRILAALANPAGTEPLDLAREQRLLTYLRRRGDLDVEILDRTTFSRLRNALAGGDFDVVHFMGHGGFDAALGQGVVYLETADGGADPVRGVDLRELLAAAAPQIVVLNACETATEAAAPEGESVPFASVAAALVHAGVPAVVAMQLPISDAAAIAFGSGFYERVAAGDPVEAAVAEGRRLIRSACRDTLEWSIPVLFLRAAPTQAAAATAPEKGTAELGAVDDNIVRAKNLTGSNIDIGGTELRGKGAAAPQGVRKNHVIVEETLAATGTVSIGTFRSTTDPKGS